jgi:superfamily II DNA or RNA helicase
MTPTLRPYQIAAVESVKDALRNGKKAPLLVAPTGAGKTVMFAHITQSAQRKGKRVLILTHRQELLDQTCRKLSEFSVDHGVILAGRTEELSQLVQVAGVQTLVRRLNRTLPPDLIVVDEAHHAAAGSWKQILTRFPHAKILGVTATPERLDGKGLGDMFDTLVRGPEVADLIEAGYLSKPRYFAPPGASLDGVRTVAGDFNRKDSEAAVNQSTITGSAVEHYKKLCGGQPAVAFCVSLKHAEQVTADFNAAGYRWAMIDGTMTGEQRRDAVRRLATGRLHGLSSCDIISEGFDLPVVSVGILLRPTQSMGLYLQQVGRVLRPAEGKNGATILDHVGNVLRHGFAEDRRDWSLEGAPRKSSKQKAAMTNRQCPKCYGISAPVPVCPQCGHSFEVKARKLEEVDGTLQEIKAQEQARILKRQEQGKAQTFDDLVRVGVARGYKNPSAWAHHVWSARKGRRPQYA